MMLRVYLLLVVLLGLVTFCECWCEPGNIKWWSWSDCSVSCGGGTRTRKGELCTLFIWGEAIERSSESCNQLCYNGGTYSGGCHCSAWRTDTCCSSCRLIDIPNCKPDQQECGGSPDNIRCTDCYDPYYPAGYGKGCAFCPNITNCQDRHCTNLSDATCNVCKEGYFMQTPNDTKCKLCPIITNCQDRHCTNLSDTTCNVCTEGFFMQTPNDTKCEPCPSITNCEVQQCTSLSNTTCILCNEGFFTNTSENATCEQIPDPEAVSLVQSIKFIAGVSGGLVIAGLIVVVIVLIVARKYSSEGCTQSMKSKSETVVEQSDENHIYNEYDNSALRVADNIDPQDDSDNESDGYDTLNQAREQPWPYDTSGSENEHRTSYLRPIAMTGSPNGTTENKLSPTTDYIEPQDDIHSDADETFTDGYEKPRPCNSLQKPSEVENQQGRASYLELVEVSDIPYITVNNNDSSTADHQREIEDKFEVPVSTENASN